MDFHVIKNAVAKQFEKMSKHQLFVVGIDRDKVWETYLSSFPEGANPMYRERTEHDCSCCKQFIRTVGGVVAVIDGKLESIWDISIPKEPAYQAVADGLSAYVKSLPITDKFLHYERHAGTDKNYEQLVDGVTTWDHFFVNIPAKYVMRKDDIASKLSVERSTHDVFLRSLKEIDRDAIDTVLELIAQNSLYRGEEHKFVLETFRKVQAKFDKLDYAWQKDMFAWDNMSTVPESVARIRNTAIGTLLTDLSGGKELEDAVKAFESKVAPTNYKRPTALITPRMIEQAKTKLSELGLTSALERRYATLNDVTVNNIIFANRDARRAMTGDVFDDLTAENSTKITKNLDRIEQVPIDKFIAEIVPKATTIEVLVENRHASNFVSLIAAVDPTAGELFKWPNKFSWSYAGEMADSIKERVKQAGGNVTGDLCCRLAWYNHDDLDFHMKEPGGYEIYFGNRHSKSPLGGRLDVDMNAGHGTTREPVENIFYESQKTMKEGVYTLFVNNFSKRETRDVGFDVEIDFMGTTYSFAYDQSVANRANVEVAKFKYTRGKGIEFISSLPMTTKSKTVWGVNTQSFQPVDVLMLSPNHWDENAVGNKHYFFMLSQCANDGTARGFFNEFLKEDLNAHRKVFEVVGSKMKVADSAEQLSGIGFSSTQPNTLVCRVTGSFTRVIDVVF